MKKLLTIILVACAVGAQAQQQMSLAQAQEYALSNNLTLRNTNLDLEKAKRKVWETAADGMPQIAATGSYQHMLSKLPELDLSGGAGGEAGKVTLGVLNTYTAGGTINQLIFNGSYIVGLQAAKTYRNFAELGVEKSIIEIRASVAQSYYMCLVSSYSHVILQENLGLLEKTVKEMRAMKEQGLIDRTSLDQLEVSYNLLAAQCNSAGRQVKNTRDMLKYIIGMPMSEPIELTDQLESILSEVSADYLNLTDYSQDQHIDTRLAQMDVKVNQLLLKLEKSAYLPTIGAQLGLSHNFTMPEFSFQSATTTYFGASVSLPIFTSGKTHSKVQQARITLNQSKNKEALARQSLDLEFQGASDAFQLAWDNFEVQKRNLKLAARVLEDMKKSITVGMKSSTELIQANNSYLEAVGGMISSELNLLNSKTRIDKILSK